MSLEIVTLPAREDNYFFLIHNHETGETALVDAPEAAPVQAALAQRGWVLSQILLTHHHWDHISGVAALREQSGARVIGSGADAARLPDLDLAVAEGDGIQVAGQPCDVFDVSGHTINHIAFYLPDQSAVFTGDSLMALGCGRMVESTHDQMYESLTKLAALPEDTCVYSGHEYSETNARFAKIIDPKNPALDARVADIAAARKKSEPTVPSLLGLERQTNPYLRCEDPAICAGLGLENAPPEKVFAEIRRRKDVF